MKYKKIILVLLLISLIFLSVESISAENVMESTTNDTATSDFNLDGMSIDSDTLNQESQNVLSTSNEELISEMSIDPMPNIETGVVSGGVDFTNIHPWAPSDSVNGNKGKITYKIPSSATNIKSAYIYVNIYSGSGNSDIYGLHSNVTLTTDSTVTLGSENLTFTGNQQDDPTVYIINDHITKVYSDYMIFYNVTDLLQGLNGTSVSVDVLSYPMVGKSFDGRIKLISLFVAWDDGDDDEIYYWLNAGQSWTNDVQNGRSHKFENIGDLDFSEKQSTIINVAASSTDAFYLINGMPFFSENDADEYINGAYYQYHKWDVSNYVEPGTLELGYKAIGGAYGPSFKNLISILLIQDIPKYEDTVQISLTPEFNEIPSAYAGTNNTLTVKIAVKEGNYAIRLLADGKIVNKTEKNLNEGINTLLLTDPTIRQVDESTINGVENKKVNYTVQVLSNGNILNSSSISIPVLYNGNLGKDLAYPADGINSFFNITVNGDIVIAPQNYSNYISADVLNRTEVWDVNLDADSNIVKSFIYIPYYEFNSQSYPEDENIFKVEFNDVNVIPVAFYRDQSNLGRSYYSGYGVLVYDVTNLIRNGKNYLKMNKMFDTPAVYPSALIYMYNTTGSSSIKEIYIYNGADLLEAVSGNVAERTVHTDTLINVNSKLTSNATLYVFAAGPQSDEGDLIFNGEKYKNIWNATSSSNEVYSLDVTNSLKDSNSISFVSTGYRIIALQQIMVLDKNLEELGISFESEYPNICYAGTNNYITVNIDAVKNNKVITRLSADGKVVDEREIDLVYGLNNFTLVDPTIRPVDEFTINGADNKKVKYTVEVSSNGNLINSSSVVLPILYNGYLGKDLAYPVGGIDSFLNITVNGDIVVDVKDDSSYLGDFDIKRNDVWNVNLDNKSSVVKAFVYVPYSLANVNLIQENNMFNVKFNGNNVVPLQLYRDQNNLDKYGKYGYGLVIYDVTALLKNGENTFELNKAQPTPKVYPSTLIYMYNTTGSTLIKNIYISNGADLLSRDSNRLVHIDSTINVDFIKDVAKLHVFAANAQDGDGDIVFNGKLYENVWKGNEFSTELFTLDISNTIKNTNEVSFVANDTILALQQIIVTTQKSQSQIVASDLTVFYDSDSSLVIGLSNGNGNVIPNVDINVVFNGNASVLTTDKDGQVSLPIISTLLPNSYDVSISYLGDDNYIKSSKDIKVIVEKVSTQINASDLTIRYNNNGSLIASLSDANGNVIPNAELNVVFNGDSTVLTTDKDGKITLPISGGLIPDIYGIVISFKANQTHKESSKTVNLVIEKIPTQITPNKITVVYNTNNKKTVATLKDDNGNAIANAKVTVDLNGNKKEIITDENGQVILDVPSKLVPKTYTATVSFEGNSIHAKSSASSKVVVKKASVKLSASKKTYKLSVKTKKYTVTLKNNKGAAMKKVTLTLKVKGKTYKATTTSKGKATFKITKLTKKGKFYATITFKATKYFNKSVKKVKITVKK